MRPERRTDAGPEGRASDFQFHLCETLSKPRGELKPRSRWSGIRTSPIKGDGRIRTELAPLGHGDQALLGSTFVSLFHFFHINSEWAFRSDKTIIDSIPKFHYGAEWATS